MKIRIKFFLIAACAIGILGLAGCNSNEGKGLYEPPPWLGGSSIETLEGEGNYDIFLELMEKANYKEPISKQLFTLFVPNDDAFRAYFNKVGVSSVDDLSKDEAVQLFTLHVLRNPRSRFLLIYEYVYSEFQGPDQGHNGEYMSLFHRKRTPSVTTPYTEEVRYYADMVGEEVLMTSGRKSVPLFTDEWFHDFGSFDHEGDYLYLYPESQWRAGYQPEMAGTNWHSAMVLPHTNDADEVELEVRSASGFIYYIDRVVEPMPSMDEYLSKNSDKYGLYYDMLQRFATYSPGGTTDDGRRLYTKDYDLVYNLADESAGSALGNFPQDMWSAFVPNNTLFQSYLDNTIFKFYDNLDSVPKVTLYYILQSHLASELMLVSKMENSFFNAFGDQMEMSRDYLEKGYMCSNGVVYEINKIIEPNVFTTVPGLLFFDKDYSTLLFVLSEADVLINLADPTKRVTLFASTNEQLEEYGVRYDEIAAEVQFRSPANGKWSPMSSDNLLSFAQNQFVIGENSDFSGNGFIETASGTFINYSNNVIQASENQNSGVVANVEEVMPNDKNGYLVKVSEPIQSRFRMGQYLSGDPEVSIFHDMLVDLKYINTRGSDPYTKEKFETVKFFAGADSWTSFIPTNEAMSKAITDGIIPDVTAGKGWNKELSAGAIDSLSSWIDYHFVRNDVVFDDGVLTGSFDTNAGYMSEDGKTMIYTPIAIDNELNSLSIQDATGQDIVVDHAKANILVQRGVVHKLDSVLKLYE